MIILMKQEHSLLIMLIVAVCAIAFMAIHSVVSATGLVDTKASGFAAADSKFLFGIQTIKERNPQPIRLDIDCSNFNGLLGDVDENGLIDVVDLVNLVPYILGEGDLSSSQICAANVNDDDVIDVVDLVQLVDLILNPGPRCIGVIPSNAQLCSGDDEGLTHDWPFVLVRTCTSATKCETVCNNGFRFVQGVCIEMLSENFGNGIIDLGEQCDDGNSDNGDGCTWNGYVESGWECNGEPSVCENPGCMNEDASNYDEFATYDDGSCIPELFEFFQTSLQSFYFFFNATIDGVELDAADWIGGFNGDVCVGANQWLSSNTVVTLIGYNGDPQAQGYMLPGNIPSFKIYDSSEGVYYDAVPSNNCDWSSNNFCNINLLSATNIYE